MKIYSTHLKIINSDVDNISISTPCEAATNGEKILYRTFVCNKNYWILETIPLIGSSTFDE